MFALKTPKPSISRGQPYAKDPITYDMAGLLGFRVFVIIKRTMWDSVHLWKMLLRLFLITVGVCFISFFAFPGADPSQFQEIGEALTVFLTFLLGLKLQATIDEWQTTAKCFMSYMVSMRNLQLLLLGIDSSSGMGKKCMKYCMLAVFSTIAECELREKNSASEHTEETIATLMKKHTHERLFLKLPPQEQETWEKYNCSADIMWLWTVSLLGRMAANGELANDTTQADTYSLIMGYFQAIQSDLDTMRITAGVTTPFVIMHSLAVLVNLNNVLSAVCCGLTNGVAIQCIFADWGFTLTETGADEAVWSQCLQDMIVSMLKSSVVPLMFIALFTCAAEISHPFTSEEGGLPCERLLNELVDNLKQIQAASADLPWKDGEKADGQEAVTERANGKDTTEGDIDMNGKETTEGDIDISL